MAKKDPGNNLDTVSANETSGDEQPSKKLSNECEEKGAMKTEIKNAHASGNGSIGRNDEDLAGNNAGSEVSGF